MRTYVAAALTFCLLLAAAMSPRPAAHAQGRRGSLSREEAPKDPINIVPILAKEETSADDPSGEPKVETRDRLGRKDAKKSLGTNVGLDLHPAGDADAPGAGVAGGAQPNGSKAAKASAVPYVGVIAGVSGCPAGSDMVTIGMDDEDRKNSNTSGGWIGGIVHDKNTTFRFCRVDGSKFEWPGATYAVLQLSASCPVGSYSFSRRFDNEDNQNSNSFSLDPPNLGLGGISPNISDKQGTSTTLHFCAFTPAAAQSLQTQGYPWPFPDFGIEYGVFAQSNLPGALDSGYINIDDEDFRNTNSFGGYYANHQSELQHIIYGDQNTGMRMVKVRSGKPLPQLHSVSLNVSKVKGGDNGTQPVITVSLDGPAPPGGQRVYLSTNKPSVTGIMGPGYFTIPAGQTTESLSWFLSTSKVYGNDVDVTITATVNSVKGYAHIKLEKTKLF